VILKKRILNNLVISFIDEVPDFKYFSLNQIHSNKIFFIEDIRGKTEGDGLLTRTGKILCIKTADCIPLVILTPNPFIYGIFHVGWRGLFKGIIKRGIEKFLIVGFKPSDLYAYIGPSICSNCYEVGKEFVNYDNQFLFKRNNHYFYDLKGRCLYELSKSGLKNIFYSDLCTFENEFLPSYRRDKSAGRILNCVMVY